jgi:hypothetical protein
MSEPTQGGFGKTPRHLVAYKIGRCHVCCLKRRTGDGKFGSTISAMKSSLLFAAACLALVPFKLLAVTTHYVDAGGTNAVPPYTDWSTAATNIQDAVDAATNGDLVLVTNGIYATGGRMWNNSVTNRVTLTNAVTLQSVNGPAVTWIVGCQDPGASLWQPFTNAVRCVGMGAYSVLSGFTLTNGESAIGGGVSEIGVLPGYDGYLSSLLTNCFLINNSATLEGGGAYSVTLINCTLSGNYAMEDGGGAASSKLVNCIVTSNSTPTSAPVIDRIQGTPGVGEGGGIYDSDAINCLIAGNRAFIGGGVCGPARLINCTIVGNVAAFAGGISWDDFGNPGNHPSCLATNCIIYYNLALTNANNHDDSIIVQSCTMPMPASGQGNITNAPGFVDLANGDYHLASDSPLINSGFNAIITKSMDLDGNPRIVGGTVDIGAYEYQSPTSVLPYAWARQYGFPTDGSADRADPDHDGMNNRQEFLAGTNPTNAASTLAMTSVYPYNNTYLNWHWAIVKWQSVSTRNYYLLRSSDLGNGFTCIQSNLVGNAGTTIYQDTTATNGGPYFYRVGVQ